MAQFIRELQQQAIIWLHLLSWLAIMAWIHTPPSRSPRKYTPKQKRRNLMIAALAWMEVMLDLRLIPVYFAACIGR